MKRFFCAAVILSMLAPASACAHEVLHRVSRDGAVVVELFYPDGTPFSFEQYEVCLRGDEWPYQTGRSDALGRIVFLPDRRGAWQVRAFSEDGHGIDITIDAGPEDAPQAAAPSRSLRLVRTAIGIAAILAVFALLKVLARRRALRS